MLIQIRLHFLWNILALNFDYQLSIIGIFLPSFPIVFWREKKKKKHFS